MSYFEDDFDPSFHTGEENAAHAEERLAELEARYNTDPVFRQTVDELAAIGDDLDAAQRGLVQLEHDDPVGMTVFGGSDSWLEPRLSGEIDTRPK
jgi:hypothetical protein